MERFLQRAACLAVVLGFLTPPTMAAAVPTPIEIADDLYEKGNLFDAFLAYKTLAEEGNREAQNKLGAMYRDAQGTERDYGEAMRWFRESASRGDAKAFINIGFLYGNGRGVPRDYEEEMRWIRRAAEALDPVGQYDLGVMIAEARRSRDFEAESATWIEKAAQQGYPPALREMGSRYARGRGVARDDHAAYYCLFLSSLLGEKPGLLLSDAGRRLSKDQLSRIQKDAKSWVHQNAPFAEANANVQSSTDTVAAADVPSAAPSSDSSPSPRESSAPLPVDPTARPAGY